MQRIVVTGASGLLGRHTAVRLYARNRAAAFGKTPIPFDVVCLDRAGFNPTSLRQALTECSGVIHFAGINRGTEEDVEHANPALAGQLVQACRDVGVKPHIVYANSTHAQTDSAYGRGKRRAGEILAAFANNYTDLVLPHIYGEGARPYYNNVTATLIDQVIKDDRRTINPGAHVSLLHAGVAAEAAIDALLISSRQLCPQPLPMSVLELLTRIESFHASYQRNVFPDLADAFDLTLFNAYRTALYPQWFPRTLTLSRDHRGTLFEAVKGGGGGQTFLSWTAPGITRGDHFHLSKVERFLVLQGEAKIRIRPVMGNTVWQYRVSGDMPAVVDMPTLHTHSIENIGAVPLLTLFWSHEIFDPEAPDTFSDPVLKATDETA